MPNRFGNILRLSSVEKPVSPLPYGAQLTIAGTGVSVTGRRTSAYSVVPSRILSATSLSRAIAQGSRRPRLECRLPAGSTAVPGWKPL